MIDLCNDTVFMTFMYVYNFYRVISVILIYYIHEIYVLFIKIEIYKLNQGPQAVGYVFFLKLRRRVRIFSSPALESAFEKKNSTVES